MRNDCGEIASGPLMRVQPEWQIQLMNGARVKQGLPQYTPEEIEVLLSKLRSQNNEG